MSRRHWRERVNDILTAMVTIQQVTAGMDAATLAANTTILQAVLYNFIIIGEAARSMPIDVCDRHPHIAWKGMREMRNFVAHVYFGVDANRVHESIANDFPVAVASLRRLLETEQVS